MQCHCSSALLQVHCTTVNWLRFEAADKNIFEEMPILFHVSINSKLNEDWRWCKQRLYGCTVCQWLTAMCCTCCPCLWWCVWCMQSIMCHYLWPRPPLHYPALYNVLDTRLAGLSNPGPRSSTSGATSRVSYVSSTRLRVLCMCRSSVRGWPRW